ncbi:MFS transporter (plasmid) [Haloimpatiens sp. FM7330]|uniref:MFS transporter n=1 Tax=Haloimpatiens sp. FM7330 TaxID=3298610 RepID=UPI003628C5BE
MNTEVAVNKQISYKNLLSEKQYIKNLVAKLISRFGDSLDSIAYSWMVYELTGSKVLMASLFAVNGIPNVIFGMISGVFAGYHSKKKIMFFCDIGRGITVFLTALLFMLKLLKPWHLYVLTFINSSFESFRAPSSTSLYSMILDKEKFDYGISLDNTLVRIVEMVGFSLAAVFIALIGTGGTIIIDSITFFICASIVITIKYKDSIKKEAMTIKSGIQDFKEGLKYLLNSKLIVYVSIFAAGINIFLVPFNALEAPYVKEVLCKGPEALSIISVPFLAGMICSGLIFPRIKKKISGFYTFILGGILVGMNYFALSQLGRINQYSFMLILLGFFCFFMGLGIILMNTTMQVAFMTSIDKEFLPRAAAISSVMDLCSIPIGGFIVGGLCKFFSIPQLFMIVSTAIIILSVSQLFNKELKKI